MKAPTVALLAGGMIGDPRIAAGIVGSH